MPTLLYTSAPNALARRHTHTDVCHQQTKCLKITSSPFALFCLWLKAIMLGQRGERSRGRGSPGAAEDSCDRATGPSLSSAFLLEVLVLSCINNGHLCWSEMLLIYFMLITASACFKQKGFDTSSSNSKEFHSAESISETTTLKTPKAPLDGTGGSFQLASNLKLSHGESETGASKTQTQPTCPGTRLQGLGQLKQKLVQAWKYSPRSQKLKR